MVETIVIIVVVLAVIIGALLIFAASRPDSFRVERSLSIAAPAEKIFALVNDLRSHGVWSPWEKKDPAMNRTYSGAASGKGAIYEWDGNKNIGQGRMEITDETPPNRVIFKMDFFRPFKAHNTAEITLEPQGDATRVTWAIYGPSPFMSKVMGLLCNFDRMIGREFETGLANLKTLTER
jgi:carbon monoxide dehydrogenase subunit G